MVYNPLAALLAGIAFIAVLSLIFWPDTGLYWRWQQTRRLTQRVLTEDALKHIHQDEMDGRPPTIVSIAGSLHISQNETAELLTHMQDEGLLQIDGDNIELTPEGRSAALHIIRAHRLWEQHLAEETGYHEVEWHTIAEAQEHELSTAELDDIANRLGNPTYDPHGDPIPTAEGKLIIPQGQPLSTLPANSTARIVHLEDEPEVVYAQLAAEGLYPGMIVHVIEASPQRIIFWVNGDEHVLAPMLAANVSVVPVETAVAEEPDLTNCEALSCLEPGEVGEVVALSPACRGAERRRFLDLGILPGTKITVEFRSPGGDPTAYNIRGAAIALRKDQTDLIKVRKIKEEIGDRRLETASRLRQIANL
ncbi:MAG TPA: metal-dependent transcriptional regulator [Anaerolineae bacterium]|nr:metal-dependent transcriptional regulator [Anaerolineae bacterium]